MKKNLAFFPWLNITGDIELHSVELKRYERGSLPFGKNTRKQNACDEAFSHYKDRTGEPISFATILKLKFKEADIYLSEDDRNFLREAAQIIAFSGLSERKFFVPGHYWNADNFHFVILEFTDTSKGFTVVLRRRYGQVGRFYSPKLFSETVPAHVNNATECKIDVELANALLKLREEKKKKNSKEWKRFLDVIFFYNLANTDNPSIIPQQEVVMLLWAFQRLLGCEHADWKELVKEFASKISFVGEGLPLGKSKRPLEWYRKKKVLTIREVWIMDFYRLRGEFAHGKTEDEKPPSEPLAWTMDEHLLLASFIFPLLLKVVLNNHGFYALTECDRAYIRAFDELTHDPFGRVKTEDEPESWWWNKVITDKLLGYP